MWPIEGPPAREILESVHADLAGFTGGAPPADDRTRHPQGVTPDKRLGQHFLTDRNILQRIVDALDPAPDDVVVEIGAGRGA